VLQIPPGDKIVNVQFIGFNNAINRVVLKTSNGATLATGGTRITYCLNPFDYTVSTAGLNVIGFSAAFSYNSGFGFCVSNMGIQI
jgi:hypothetical protein